jgi:hypothetical protein
MHKFVLAFATLMVLSPVAALAQETSEKTQMQTPTQMQDHSVPDFYLLELGGAGN